MADPKPTPDEMRECLNDARIAAEVMTALCDADISGIRSPGIDLACNIRWLASIQQNALETIERGMVR